MWERRHSRGFMAGSSRDVVGFCALLVCLIASLGKSMTLDVMSGKESCVIVHAEKGNTVSGNFELLTPGGRKDFMVILQSSEGLFYRENKAREGYFTLTAPEGSDYHLCFVNKDKKKQDSYAAAALKEAESKKGIDEIRKKDRGGNHEAEEADEAEEDDDTDDTDLSAYSSIFEQEASIVDDLDSWYAVNPGYTTFGFGLRVAEDANLEAIPNISDEDKKLARFLTEEAEILVQKLEALNDHESHLRSKEEIYHSSVGRTASQLIWYTFIEGIVLLAVSWTQLSYIRRFFETKRVL